MKPRHRIYVRLCDGITIGPIDFRDTKGIEMIQRSISNDPRADNNATNVHSDLMPYDEVIPVDEYYRYHPSYVS